jgi:F-type H+-transporting ATPase subunit delta
MPGAVATRYAQALADAALAPGADLDGRRAAQELRSFEQIIQASPELKIVLLSPAVPTSRKRAVVARLADSIPLSRLVKNLLYVIVDRRRVDLLDDITDAFEVVLDERLGFVRAQVTSAMPLSEQQQTQLQEALSQVTGKNVRCEFGVDPNLIGGVVARIGSTVYDGSVRTQMELLRERLTS